jgi:hypothetical protein
MVLAVLTLFAIAGLSLVLYAGAQARAAQISREAETSRRPDVGPEALLSYFLGQLIYDVPDDNSGVYSALRGHSLARLLYGYNDQLSTFTPFDGTGRLHAASPFAGVDDCNLVNYTFYSRDGFLRDPERLSWRAGLDQPRGLFTGGFNVPYTYPDLNNMFLAAVKADGTLLIPSFHRAWTGFGSLDPSNPNWHDANPALKYLVLRPRPAENPAGFPAPEDSGGDVKNLIGAPGGNDSIWLDLSFPVLTAVDGRRFKPLFAPLIVDLDNRLNVNAHGNVRGQDNQGLPAHASNQGWGAWEVNLGYVLTQKTEWPNLFQGRATPPQLGRYGGNPWSGKAGMPGGGDQAFSDQPRTAPHSYAAIDFDGCDEQNGFKTSAQFLLPGQGGAAALSCFPPVPSGYGNGDLAERKNHPLLFDPLQADGANRPFAPSNLEALLRAGDTGSEAFSSELLRLCPTCFADARTRRLVTTHSFDLDKPGVAPWLYSPTAAPYQVAASTPDQAPTGGPSRFPDLSLRNAALPAQSEFTVDWRAVSAMLERVNLNRPLPPYPHQGSGSSAPYGPPLIGVADRFDTDQAGSQYLDALFERQRLADNIYRQFLKVTGVVSPVNPAAPTDAELMPRRWLAQLAANIVDFIDEDEISTPFNFYTEQDAYPSGPLASGGSFDPGATNGDPELPRYWVFGTELPRLVVNEVLAEYQELAIPAPGLTYACNFWVELMNPLLPAGGAQQLDGAPTLFKIDALPSGTPSTARTKNANSFLAYQVVIADTLYPRPATNDNVLGKPNQIRTRTSDVLDTDLAVPISLMNGQPQMTSGVAPQGFLLLCTPTLDVHGTFRAVAQGGSIPNATPVARLPGMQYLVTYGQLPDRTPDDRTNGVMVCLRRLANPHIPFDPNPTFIDDLGGLQPNPWYNPYQTIDYLEKVPLRNATDPTLTWASRGKNQPYAACFRAANGDVSVPAVDSPVVDQQGVGQTVHSFGRINNPVPSGGHYDWLVHLDRQLINPMELLQVSGCQPHQLTQRFMTGNTVAQRFKHRAPWFDPGSRLYRVFEFVEAREHAAGVLLGGRLPGQINLNTLWDPEPFLALCDPQPANAFSLPDVQSIYTALTGQRTPSGVPGAGDQPFLSLATGPTPADDAQFPAYGIQRTLLRGADPKDPGSRRLFQPDVSASTRDDDPARHPYLQNQLLTKIFNQVTTRSNVFAIWVTVGFFEVTDQTTAPPRLGAELGRSENRQVRHRLFAVVDRTNLAPNPVPVAAFDPRKDPAVLYFSIID